MEYVASIGRSESPNPHAEMSRLPLGAGHSSMPVTLDGESAMCLTEVSHALHRASVALGGMVPGSLTPSMPGRVKELDCDGNVLEGIERDTAQGNIDKAIALVDGLIESCSAQSGQWETLLPAEADCVPDSRRHSGSHGVATENADALQAILEDIAGDLNSSVIRCSSEAALILQGALQFESNHEVTRRISSVIDLLDENICEVRELVFGLGSHGDVRSKLS